MKLSKIVLSMALAAIVAFTLSNPMLLAQGIAPCANPATNIAQSDGYSNGLALVWKHHYAASDGHEARSDEYYNGPALVWMHDYNAAYHRDVTPCLPAAPPPISVKVDLAKPPASRTPAPLSLSREDKAKFNEMVEALRQQNAKVADALANLANNSGNIRDILSLMEGDMRTNHDNGTAAALNKLSDTLSEMVRASNDTQIQLINSLASNMAELNKTQVKLLGVEQDRRNLEKRLVFWTKWNAIANTFAAAAEWSQFGLAAKTGGYGSSAAASASSVALAQKAAAVPQIVFQ